MPNVTIAAENRRLTEAKYIHSLMPVFWADPSKHDGNEFPSDDMFGRPLVSAAPIRTPQGRFFDHVDDKITLPQSVSQSMTGAAGVTLLMWVRQDVIDATAQQFFIISNSGNVARLSLGTLGTTGAPSVTVRTGVEAGQVASGPAVAVNGWHLWTIVVNLFTSSIDVIYDFNKVTTSGLTFASGVFTDSIQASGGDRIGLTRADTLPFGGVIGHVLLFNRALMPATIQRLFEMTKWRYI